RSGRRSARDGRFAARSHQGHQPEQDLSLEGDTPRSRSEIRSSDVEENRTPGAWNDRLHVVADDAQRVVEVVLPPHPLGTGGIGKGNVSVIVGVARVVDPAIARRQRFYR